MSIDNILDVPLLTEEELHFVMQIPLQGECLDDVTLCTSHCLHNDQNDA